MKDNQKKPLQVAISGMDDRAFKMMVMFFQGPCKGSAIVVKDDEAEVEILDADSINAKSVLAEKLSAHPERPVIVLSLQELALENIIFVKKPVQTANMLSALEQARKEIKQRAKKTGYTQTLASETKPKQEQFKMQSPNWTSCRRKPQRLGRNRKFWTKKNKKNEQA